MGEAPSSPRSAALYYWGGNDDTSNGIMDDILPKHEEFYWEEVESPSAEATRVAASEEYRIDKMEDWGRPRSGNSRARLGSTRRVQLKFNLPIRDEDDDTHWMFLRPHSQTVSLGGCFVDTETEVSEDDVEEAEIDESPEVGQSGSLGVPTMSYEATVSTIQDDFHSIPIIDLSLPLHGRNGYASRIAQACRSSGFFYIINHGVAPSLMRAVMDKSRDFFALPGDEKAACGWKGEHDKSNFKNSNGYRGYFGIGMEDLENKDGTRDLVKEEGGAMQSCKDGQRITGDQKEGFDCGLECIPGYHEDLKSRQAYLDFFGENYWPDESVHANIFGFRETLLEYQKALLKLSDVLLTAFAVSLSSSAHSNANQDGECFQGTVPADYFLSRSRNPMCTLRLLHYPPTPKFLSSQSNELLKSPSGCGAHTDYGLFTILQQDEIGGLQVRNKSNEWIDARPLPGSFVINVGDMLSWWTEGKYASTVHRVISPQLVDEAYEDDEYEKRRGQRGEAGRHRYSIPFFFNPDHDAVVRPIKDVDTVMSENGNWRTAIEILKERYAGTFKAK
ncbi:hypothetical protein ACHAW6_005744 [Cyclotella cf. meneghiniana]